MAESKEAELAERIGLVASQLADEYAGLDKKRVINVLARTMTEIHGRPLLTKWPKAKMVADSTVLRMLPIWFSPTISEALQYLPPEEAFALFEKDDLDLLHARQRYVSYLGSGEAPLYSIKQVADAIDSLLKHQAENRQSLVETGHPCTVFKHSTLLTERLVELYPIRWPCGVWQEEGEYSYSWSTDRWNGELECSYENAPLSPGLSIEDAARLQSLRGKFYNARAEMLRATARSLRKHDAEALWDKSLSVLTGALSADEVDFLLRIDGSQTGFQLDNRKPTQFVGGDLSSMFGFVGYCEMELTIGTMAKVHKALGKLVRDNEWGYPHIPYVSYYEVVNKPEQQRIESVCDMLAKLGEQEKEFLGEYEQKVNCALEEEFKQEFIVKVRAEQRYVSSFKTTLEQYAEIEAQSLSNAKGSTPPLTTTQEKAYKKEKYATRSKLYFPGTEPGEGRNLFFVNGTEVTMPGVSFAVLLRLVVELKEKKGGWVSAKTLVEEGLLPAETDTKKYSEINHRLKESNLPRDIVEKLIESRPKKGRRLSTHPDFVTYDKNQLKLNCRPKIREVAETLR